MTDTKTTENTMNQASGSKVKITSTEGYRHGIMRNLEKQSQRGNFDQAQVLKRTARAVNVLTSYTIIDAGRKVNGWKEKVHAYKLVKANGKGYEVQIRDNGQASCNCPDWINRRKIHAGWCKHCLAIAALNESRK